MNVLFTAFNGKNNSSKILLDKMDCQNKLYLKNSFKTSVEQLEKSITNNDYDLIISLGQAPLKIDNIKIETQAHMKDCYQTNYDYSKLIEELKNECYDVTISKNAGNYFCNNIYYYGLKFISDNKLNIKMIFIHIPYINKISNIDTLASVLKYIKYEK